jgi:hypothetical protein
MILASSCVDKGNSVNVLAWRFLTGNAIGFNPFNSLHLKQTGFPRRKVLGIVSD